MWRSFPEPDFAEVARELTRKHVTRRQLWREYRARYPKGLGYTAFCVRYQRWRATTGAEVILALEHEPGNRLYVDYSGDPAYLTDPSNGAWSCSSPPGASTTTSTQSRLPRRTRPIGCVFT